MTLRYITLAMASVVFVLALVSVIDTWRNKKVNDISQRALAVLCASAYKEKGACSFEGEGLVILVKEKPTGHLCIGIGIKKD